MSTTQKYLSSLQIVEEREVSGLTKNGNVFLIGVTAGTNFHNRKKWFERVTL